MRYMYKNKSSVVFPYYLQVSVKSQTAVVKVKEYIETIEQKIEELRNAQKAIIKRNQDAIQKLLGKEAISSIFSEQQDSSTPLSVY